MDTLEFTCEISGLICPDCADEAAAALIHTRGVISAEVSYSSARVRAEYDPALIDAAGIKAALSTAGYPAREGGKGARLFDGVSLLAVGILTALIPHLTGLISVPEAESGTPLGLIFIIGLLSGMHCIGMCGGIMLTQCALPGRARVGGCGAYNAGRIIGYTVLGALCGAAGQIISVDAAYKSMLFTICGGLVTLYGLGMWGVRAIRRLRAAITPANGAQEVLWRKRAGRPMLIGALTGLMPCGALSTMWLFCASSGSAARGALAMLCFSAGTAPAMLLFGAAGAALPRRWNALITRMGAVLIISMGLAMLIKGIRLI